MSCSKYVKGQPELGEAVVNRNLELSLVVDREDLKAEGVVIVRMF